MAVLVSVTLFLPCVKADIQPSQEFVEPIKNWSFEERGDSVYECPPWETNNGGWRELRSDINGDGYINVVDLGILSDAYLTKSGDPDYNPNADINADGYVNVLDLGILSDDWEKEAHYVDGKYSWYTSGGGNYYMWQALEDNILNKVKGKRVTFTFWFLPESVASDGSQNYARAAIWYEWHWVYGDWVHPTETKWYAAFVTAFIPSDTNIVTVDIEGKPDFKAWIDHTSLSISETKMVVDADSRRVSLAVNLFRLQKYEGLPNPCRAVLGVAMCANDPHSDDIWIDYTQIKVTLISGSFVRITNVTQSNDKDYKTDPEQTQRIENKWIVAGQVCAGLILAGAGFIMSEVGVPTIACLFLEGITGTGVTLWMSTWRSDADTPYTDKPPSGYAKAKIAYGWAPDFANERCTLELGFNPAGTCQVEITAKARFVTLGGIFPYPIVTVSTLETSILATVSL